MLLLLTLIFYITRSSGRTKELWQKIWLLDFNYCQNKHFQQRNLITFLKLLVAITGHLLLLFICLFIILSVNEFLLIIANKKYFLIQFILIVFDIHKQSPGDILPKHVALGTCCEFSVAYLCLSVILISCKALFGIVFLHCCSLVDLLHVC